MVHQALVRGLNDDWTKSIMRADSQLNGRLTRVRLS
jgi:hypothetical protein